MRRLLSLLVVTLFLGAGLAYAGDTPGKQKPRRLSDKQLDRITAGTEETGGEATGGAIVANGSSAKIKKGGSVSLDGAAQSESRALNLVNASDSGIANGVNVWDGRLETQTAETVLNVDQNNLIIQNQARSSALHAGGRGSGYPFCACADAAGRTRRAAPGSHGSIR